MFSLLALIGYISMTFLEEDRLHGRSIDAASAHTNTIIPFRLDDPSHDYYYMPSKRRSKRSFDEQDDDDEYGGNISPFVEAPTLFKMATWNN